jgi:nucleotide-binding universal stress UspA family protein
MAHEEAAATPTIVVPLDGSPTAERALPYARALAARTGGSLLLVSIVDVPVEFNAWAVSSATTSQLDSWIDARRTYLDGVARQFEDFTVHTRVELGPAATAIVDAAGEVPNPVIVMASHGRTGFRRLLLGSVAARVLSEAACPVLLIRATDEASATPTAPAFNRSLIPLDGSAFGETVLERGLAVLGRDLGLHLIRVIAMPGIDIVGSPDPEIPLNYGLIAEYMDATRQEATEYLQKLSDDLTRRGYRVTFEVRDGEVANEINRVADAVNADLIAMATHGRGGLSRLVMGSVAEKVLHGATRPLLLVRPK